MAYNINKNLAPGEELLWAGKPNIKLFHFCDIIIVPFSILVFGAIAYFTGYLLLTSDYFIWPMVFIIILFVLSVYGLVGRTIGKVVVQSKTTYYVTNHRIIIAKDIRKPEIRSKYYNSMKVIEYKEQENGRSRVVFDVSPPLTPLYANSGMEEMMSGASLYGQLPPAFYDIDDAEIVYDMVSDLRDKVEEN